MLLFTFDAQGNENKIIIDENLFPRIAVGDKDAFSALYELCSKAVFAYALSFLRSVVDAEDAASDTFLKIRTASKTYKPEGKPLAWIFTITKNICLTKFRKDSKYSKAPMDELNNVSDLDKISDSEDRIVLKAALKILSDEECQIIMLHAVSGEKHREIADYLNLPLSTVLSKYNRGIKKLRKELENKI